MAPVFTTKNTESRRAQGHVLCGKMRTGAKYDASVLGWLGVPRWQAGDGADCF